MAAFWYDSGTRSRSTGKERDSETGLDYFGARYFSGAQGRFTSPDPKLLTARHLVNPQKWNKYAYVLNNPLVLIDPDGLEELRVFLGIEVPHANAIRPGGVLDVGRDPGHTFVFTKNEAGTVTNLVSFGPSHTMGALDIPSFQSGSFKGSAHWPLSEPTSKAYQVGTITDDAKIAQGNAAMNAVKADPGVYSPDRQCTSVAIGLADSFGLNLPNGIGPYTWALGSGSSPNPYALNSQLQQNGFTSTTENSQQFNDYMNQQARAQAQQSQQAEPAQDQKKKGR